jgi:hypothetical protein
MKSQTADLQGAVNMDNESVAIKTVKKWLFGLLATALFVSCNGVDNTDYKSVDFRLRGT